MTLENFIDANRAELKRLIARVTCHVPSTASCDCPKSRTEHDHPAEDIDDDEIESWVMNDEGLYNWARSEGVRGI